MTTDHRVTIRLRYYTVADGTVRPWKWAGRCTCGWHCLSWSWSRAYSAACDPAWEAEGNPTGGGALPMVLNHVAEKQAEVNQAIDSIRRAHA